METPGYCLLFSPSLPLSPSLYLLDEKNGDCVLVEPSPSSFQEKGRFKLDPQSPNRHAKGGVWTHPVVANGCLHLRDQEFIHCYAVK